ncbi:HAD family hydrolase [Ruminiclostridium cellobioparum]|uniref:Putative hydrolase (HAD superfamily) n=1 Tax=Ruminiclostridium cellobioparum subsp. termitidis CT1112 TaxID=1195236 RepID=S0FXT3_RUMCE|nr:HAD family hydrolase [Ruminiclostridium cellobioparum]EMS73373.1 putative hydrolase (HAD superfamily) [Ruminiclostridium cellobioparum subsp. termitidis CT1112]
MENKKIVVFLDSGDTLINESTEIRDANDVVISADVIPGADAMVRTLYEKGYTIALVADGLEQSFKNVLTQNGICNCFAALINSENTGVCKPDGRMFKAAAEALDLTEKDFKRVVMVGNNLGRDVKGANELGITSVFMAWTPRYPRTPADESEVPDYTIYNPVELVDLVDKLNSEYED